MFDHISRESKFFQDFKKNHNDSPYKEMFIRINEFFPENRPNQKDIDLIYKRKEKAPFQTVEFENGMTEDVWDTFGEEQIDLDVTKEIVKSFINKRHGQSWLFLDSFRHFCLRNKKLDTNDFFVEVDIWDLYELFYYTCKS